MLREVKYRVVSGRARGREHVGVGVGGVRENVTADRGRGEEGG